MDFLLDLIKDNVGIIFTFLLATIVYFRVVVTALFKAIKEIGDVGTKFEGYYEDNKLTQEEVMDLVKEIKEAIEASKNSWKVIKGLFNKKK